ncbi:aspartate aminotransferase family protein [Frankia sp. CNm7]|uniref:Aspartate aminotransferase family protein n=1 Tax=Frankia nepalensis TaxID=1836974 RepID=A0A937RAI2_9ACTN|nr:pyridoxal-dependent decarboxylase [Frankia nepalensis]MBL7496925.1 aspartate aminotransferase family protein [Frankia nepalensis]MBL7508314.1 aspartate aminotransferase family protein [Frankia nepalensis]MBL7520994.1 aspartate aminotransferase family protein [Frankia nepalensis]MBL7626142.1 aspartate aminotransferase family protein [Frankia nepalensis]
MDRDEDLEALRAAAAMALEYAATVDDRPATPDTAAFAGLGAFDEPLPQAGVPASETLRLLHAAGSPATMASAGARYFGFVIGATLPAALGAAWLTSAWDQNAALPVMSPVAAKLHDVTRGWLLELLGLPAGSAVAYVTGATVANASCLAAARDTLLARLGWDAQADGLFGAPAFDVVIGEGAHSTLLKSLGLVGLGRSRVHVVPADDQGRMRADALPDLAGPVLVCAQAGEVNTGAFDPFDEIADWLAARPHAAPGWLHVDGAFGLWALADPGRRHLVAGLDRADSWATDGHKWLNVTHDCGLAVVRDPAHLRRTFTAAAGYVPAGDTFDPMHHTPQSSQRARQVEVWAALRTLGRAGVAGLVTRACDAAAEIARRLAVGGLTVLNEVVLNQVLVRLDGEPGDTAGGAAEGDALTAALIAEIQADGRIWCGPTRWRGRTAMRVSVSSWKTGPEDAAFAADVILTCAARVRATLVPLP